MALMENVVDAGPIPYREIALCGDVDLEHGLRHAGFDPVDTMYRLIEIPLIAIQETASMPWRDMGTAYADALKDGQEFPPIVVLRTRDGWALLDGVNRTHAYFMLKRVSIHAYELLNGCWAQRRSP